MKGKLWNQPNKPREWVPPETPGSCGRDPEAGPGSCFHWWAGCPNAGKRDCYLLWKHQEAQKLKS